MPQRSEFKRVVITGATGSIGRALVHALGTVADIIPLSSDCDLSDPAQAFAQFHHIARSGDVSHVFHLAAHAPSSAWLSANAADAWYKNTLINANVFEAHRRHIPQAKLISALSYSIYPASTRPHREDDVIIHNAQADLAAHSNYKIGILAAQAAYKQQYQTNAVSVVLPTTYGSFKAGMPSGRVIDDLIEKFIRAKAKEQPTMKVWGSGSQVRDFLYIDDAIAGLIASATLQTSDMVNLGSGQGMTIAQCAQQIADSVGYTGTILFDRDQYTGAQARVLDIALAHQELGWAPTVPFADGIHRRIQAFRDIQVAGVPRS